MSRPKRRGFPHRNTEKIAAGDLPHVSLETLMKIQTPVWAEQHKALGID